MDTLVKFEKISNEPIALVKLNRPSAMNALNKPLLEQLLTTLGTINENDEIYCTIITGSGERAFCAGADLKERRKMSEKEGLQAVRTIGQVVRQVEQMRYPVIAAINGVALGGGLELALGCDLRVAKKDAILGLTETSLAIIPGAGGTQRLSRLIGIGRAKQLIYTARQITGEEAQAYGIVEKLVSKKCVIDEAIKLAKAITTNGPIALQQAKRAINYGSEVDLETGLTIEQLCYEKTFYTKDRLEALNAFQEKRTPKFTGQ